jgi:hypothetical protein
MTSKFEKSNIRASRDLDCLIATHIMGWSITPNEAKFNPENDIEVDYTTDDTPEDCPPELEHVTGTIHSHRLPNFSSDADDAKLVLNELKNLLNAPSYWEVKRNQGSWVFECNAERSIADSKPLAICLGALKTLGIKI